MVVDVSDSHDESPQHQAWHFMAFRDFTFPKVQDQLGLKLEDADLFGDTQPIPIRTAIADFVREGAVLALATGTEKARSEFIIAPVLLELHRSTSPKFNLFSGVEWDVDRERGLNGFCDFILGRGPSQHVLQAPFVAIVEAKNDQIRTGLGQCIAAMHAAWICNDRVGSPIATIYGAVSTGAVWKFLHLRGEIVTMDLGEYYIDDLPKIMGILGQIVATNAFAASKSS